MPERTKYAMTPNQREELLRLAALGAHDRDRALSAYDAGMGSSNANVLGILMDKGFVLKRVRTRKRTSRTVYWLTEAGLAKAAELLQARA